MGVSSKTYASYITSVALLMALSLAPTTRGMKIILMYASCDNQITYLLHLLHKSVKPHLISQEENHEHLTHNFKNQEVFHVRHDLSDACMWVLQDTIAVIAISNKTEAWEGIDNTAHDYNLPHFVSPNLCHCRSHNSPHLHEYAEYLENAVFEFLKDVFLHFVMILHEEGSMCGTLLGSLLNSHGLQVSHFRVTAERAKFFKTMERFYDAWNLEDLSDEGRLLISLGGGDLSDSLIRELVEGSMKNKRTKLLVLGNPQKWQKILQNLKAYEVDIVVVSTDPLLPDDCPVALEVLPFGTHTHSSQTACRNLSSEYKLLGDAILQDFQSNFSGDCCPKSGVEHMFLSFWQSWPYENGTQRLKPEAIWSPNLGIMRMMPIDIERITLRIALVEYRPYVLFTGEGEELALSECVFKHIIEFLSTRLNFRYKLVRASQNEWGSKTEGGQWNGAIGMVMKGEADIIPYLTATPSRRQAIDYSKPLTEVEYGLLVPFPSEPPRAFIFLRPFKKEVWCLFVVTAIIVSFILHKINKSSCRLCKPSKRRAKGLSSFFRCFWLIFGAMLNQGGVHLPVTNSARLVLASWWLAVLVIMATFSANLIAFLAFPEATWVIRTLEDLVQHKTMKLTMKDDCPVLEDFRASEIEVYRKVREIFLNNPKRSHLIRTRNEDITGKVVEGKAVFIDDMNYLNAIIERDYNASNGICRLTIAPHYFSMMILALGFRRGSSILPVVNKELQMMKESGVLTHWKERYNPQRAECFSFDSNLHGQSEITLEDLQGPFFLLSIGLIFGTLILSSEYVWRRTKTALRRYIKKRHAKRQITTAYWK